MKSQSEVDESGARRAESYRERDGRGVADGTNDAAEAIVADVHYCEPPVAGDYRPERGGSRPIRRLIVYYSNFKRVKDVSNEVVSERHEVGTSSDRSECTGSLGRRRYLGLVGASALGTAIGASRAASGASEYTTYTIDPGGTFTQRVSSEETFENVLVDATAADAGVRIVASGSNWAIRNVGIKGRLDAVDEAAFRLQVNDGSTGVFENVYLGDGAVDGGRGGVFVPTSHEGTLYVSECNVQYWPDNGIYASAPGRSERGGEGGQIVIERSYARNNNIAGFRIGTDRSIVRESVVHVDEGPPANPAGKVNARGIWVKEGGSVRVENADILLAHSDGSYGVLEGDDNSVSLAQVLDSEVAATDGAGGRFRGNVETSDVGSDPNVEQPPDVPRSAKEAALGRILPKSVDIAGGTGSDTLEYAFEVTGEIAGTRSTEGNDVVSDGRASGIAVGASDIFRYSGELVGLDVDLPGNESIVSVSVDRSEGRIEFDGGARNDDRLDYYVRATGSIGPASNINSSDVYSDTEAKGYIVNGGRDTYSYTGDVDALRVAFRGNDPDLSIDIDAA